MVQVDYMIVADAATVAEGKQYIHGAGWDTLYAAAFPVTHPALAVAIRLLVPWIEANQPSTLELDVVDADGVSILPNPPGPPHGSINVGRPPNAPYGTDLVVPLVFNLAGLIFPGQGSYSVVLRIESMDAKRTTFHVSPPPGMTAQRQAP